MSVTTPIIDFVKQYASSGTARLHMPGHKGTSFLGCEPLDITEIKGADELYEPDGIIAASELTASELFDTSYTCYGTEGSSQCIRAMLYLALQSAPKSTRRPVLLAARNAHKSLLYAAALLDFDICWIWGGANALCSCPVTGQKLDTELNLLLQKGSAPFAVYITSPDYLGGMQDVSALAAVCKKYSVPLLADNAHGAYLRFLPQGGSLHPINLGAAMCCDSAHKTLPVLTGGAYLHIGKDAPIKDRDAIHNAMSLFGSTSPSYLILQSLDGCNRYLDDGYSARLGSFCDSLAIFRTELNMTAENRGCPLPLAVTACEPLKVTLDAAALGMTGLSLADVLRSSSIECEYADPRYVVLMFTPENTERELERLRLTLNAVMSSLPPTIPLPEDLTESFKTLERHTEAVCTIREAIFSPQVRLPVEEAVGLVCAMPTVSCPPAIPIVVSGEKITPVAAALMQHYRIREVSVLK